VGVGGEEEKKGRFAVGEGGGGRSDSEVETKVVAFFFFLEMGMWRGPLADLLFV
jgi:hypothetical protein